MWHAFLFIMYTDGSCNDTFMGYCQDSITSRKEELIRK